MRTRMQALREAPFDSHLENGSNKYKESLYHLRSKDHLKWWIHVNSR